MDQRALEFHPEAVAEAEASRAWCSERNPGAADAFVAELEHAVQQILEAPSRWAGYWKDRASE